MLIHAYLGTQKLRMKVERIGKDAYINKWYNINIYIIGFINSNSIACLIVLTIYLVFTLKSLIRLLNESATLVNESSKIVEDVQEKTKAVEDYVTQAVSNGQGIFKAISLVNRVRQ